MMPTLFPVRLVRLLWPLSFAAFALCLLLWGLGGVALRPLFAAPRVGETCFATFNNGTTVFSSTTAQAVREAVAAAAPGSVVKMAGYCPGVVAQGGTTQTVLITQTLTLAGGYTLTNWATAYPLTQPTTLDALGGGRVIYASVTATLQGFTVTNGFLATGNGGGIYAAGALTLTEMGVYSNSLDYGYGGGAWFGGPTTVADITFTDNRITNSGGAGGGAWFQSTATVINAVFTDNIAGVLSSQGGPNDGDGGGAWFNATTMLTDVVFANNLAEGEGGGANFIGAATLLRATFTNNTAYSPYGGGGAFLDTGYMTILDSTFIGNRAVIGDGGGVNGYYAAAITLSGTTFISNTARVGGGAFLRLPILTGDTFINNTATVGGGAYLLGGTVIDSAFVSNTAVLGGGAHLYAATVTNTTFIGNVASGNGGGACFCNYIPSLAWATATPAIGNGVGENGGRAYFDVQLANVLFARNHALGQGAAIYWEGEPQLTLLHTTIVSPTLSPKAAVYVAGGTVYLTNTLIASHTVGIERVGGTVTEDYSLFSDVPTPYSGTVLSGGHSVFGPAAFYDTQHYTLTAQSWAIDRGLNVGVPTDYFGNPRPQGTGVDMGYAEAPYAVWRYYLPLVRR